MTTSEDRAAGGGHRAARRALEMIEAIAEAPEALTLAELSRGLAVPKSSTHLLAHTLVEQGFLERDARGAYGLGTRLLALVDRLPARLGLVRAARPVMERLGSELTETVLLGIRRGDAIVYVEQVEGPQAIRYVAPLGQPRPLHCTSIGKVWLASLEPAEASALLRGSPLEPFTPATIVDPDALASELRRIRRHGHAVNRDESVAGVTAVAVPVLAGDRFVAGLSLVGPSDRMGVDLAAAARRLGEAADHIATRSRS